jgi:MoxR-like ATPase
VLSAADLAALFAAVDRVFLPTPVASFVARLVAATHPTCAEAPPEVRRFVRFGASPRAAIAIAESARASALLARRPNVDFGDVRRVAVAALAHRLVLAHAARLEGATPADVVARTLAAVDPLARPLPAEVS